jgi:methylglutaconyl-CoA hydratase
MSTNRLATSLDAGVLTLTMTRPEKRNALDSAMIEAILSELERANLDREVRVVAVRGDGKDFCAGADLAELLASADLTPEENARSAARLGEIFIRMRNLPQPVVAVVHGRVLGGGCGLASACDLVLAHEHAQFGYPEVQRGFVPAMVMTMLRRATTEKVAFDLATTGRILSASEAQQVGLVARVFPDGEFESGVQDLLATLAGASGSALALTKKQLYELEGRSFADGIQLGADLNAVARSTPDFRRAISAFLNKKS